MSEHAQARAALIRASRFGVKSTEPEGKPVDCLSAEAIFHATTLALAGQGKISFTANRLALATQIVREDTP